MSQRTPGDFTYDLDSITRNVPPTSGVYAIYSPSQCIYVGESDDICASLLEIFFEDNPCLNDKYLTHFTFELVPPEARVARQIDRIRELCPVCNLATGSPTCGKCRYSGGQRPESLLVLAEAANA